MDSSLNIIVDTNKGKGKNWNPENTKTLLKWITIGSCFIKFLDGRISTNRLFIRLNTLQSIIMNTATGSIGVSQISSIFTQKIQLILTLIFTFMAFTLTITTGVIKVCQIHENLEKSIQIRQEWASFITNISTELQLPIEERQDALKIIRDNKNIYLSLLNKDIELGRFDANTSLHETVTDLQTKMRGHMKLGYNDIRLKAINEHFELVNTIGISISDITTGIVQNEIELLHTKKYFKAFDDSKKTQDIENSMTPSETQPVSETT